MSMKAGTCLALLIALSVAGCGGSDGAKKVKVAGQVTMDGRPLQDASIQFIPSGGDGKGATGLTDAEGKYQMLVPAGDYKVVISKVKGGTVKNPDPEETMSEFELGPSGKGIALPKQLVPEKYSDPARSQLKFTVPADGAEDADFTNLTSK